MVKNKSEVYSKLKPENMAVVVVLYNPDNNQIDNLGAFSKFKKVIIIDNSRSSRLSLVRTKIAKSQLIYQHHPTNIGLSKAYNIALSLAKENHIDYLMIADQDSEFSAKVIAMLPEAADYNGIDLYLTAILSFANYTREELAEIRPDPKASIWEDEVMLSSGSIINVSIVSQLGGFDERLFIDCVDTDLSLTALEAGYKLVKFSGLPFVHSIGFVKIKDFPIIGRRALYNHRPERYYYQIRNNLLIRKKFINSNNDRVLGHLLASNKLWINNQMINIFLEADTIKKLKYAIRAFIDRSLDRYGKL